jgi:hypothetical protein
MMRQSGRAGGVVHPVGHSYGALKDGLSGIRALLARIRQA